MYLPPLGYMKAFEAASRLGSLTGAAKELNVTHAAISQQMKQLETWLGRRLFERAGRGVTLTQAGVEFGHAVEAGLSVISASARKLKRERDRKSLTVGCIPSIASRWLVPALPDFIRSYPSIDVRVQYAQANERFDPERAQVLITFGVAQAASVRSVRLFSRRNKPVAGARYIEKHPEILVPGGLRRAELLHDETLEAWADWFREAGVERERSMRGPVFQDFNLLASVVIAGHGVALCPVEVFRREIQTGDLVVLSDIATLVDEHYVMVREDAHDTAVSSFLKWFQLICVADPVVYA